VSVAYTGMVGGKSTYKWIDTDGSAHASWTIEASRPPGRLPIRGEGCPPCPSGGRGCPPGCQRRGSSSPLAARWERRSDERELLAYFPCSGKPSRDEQTRPNRETRRPLYEGRRATGWRGSVFSECSGKPDLSSDGLYGKVVWGSPVNVYLLIRRRSNWNTCLPDYSSAPTGWTVLHLFVCMDMVHKSFLSVYNKN